MDIEKLIERECKYRHEDSNSGIHDRAYEQALRRAYHHYENMTLGQLKTCQMIARDQFRTEHTSHRSIANCMVIHELIKERENTHYPPFFEEKQDGSNSG